MKNKTLTSIVVFAVLFLVVCRFDLDARSHFGFSIGGAAVQPAYVYQPVYVNPYGPYYYNGPVVYPAPCCQPVAVYPVATPVYNSGWRVSWWR